MIKKEMDEAPVLILEGGAMRGLFTAGVLDAFMDHRFYFRKAAGISAGTGLPVKAVRKKRPGQFRLCR